MKKERCVKNHQTQNNQVEYTTNQSPVQRLFVGSPFEELRKETVVVAHTSELSTCGKEGFKDFLIVTLKLELVIFLLAILIHASGQLVDVFTRTGSIYNQYAIAVVLSILSLVLIFCDFVKKRKPGVV